MEPEVAEVVGGLTRLEKAAGVAGAITAIVAFAKPLWKGLVWLFSLGDRMLVRLHRSYGQKAFAPEIAQHAQTNQRLTTAIEFLGEQSKRSIDATESLAKGVHRGNRTMKRLGRTVNTLSATVQTIQAKTEERERLEDLQARARPGPSDVGVPDRRSQTR